MWQRSPTSPVKDSRISWSSEFRRGLEKNAKGTWSWSEGWGYNLRTILNSISVVIRKGIAGGMHCAWPGDTHRDIRDSSTAVPSHVQHESSQVCPAAFQAHHQHETRSYIVTASTSRAEEILLIPTNRNKAGSSSKAPGFSLAGRTHRKSSQLLFQPLTTPETLTGLPWNPPAHKIPAYLSSSVTPSPPNFSHDNKYAQFSHSHQT